MMSGHRGHTSCEFRNFCRSLRHSSVLSWIEKPAWYSEVSVWRCVESHELHQIHGCELAHVQAVVQGNRRAV